MGPACNAVRSKPDPYPGNESGADGVFAINVRIAPGLSDLSLPGHADVGRELALNLVSESQTDFSCGQSRADSARRHVLRGKIQFNAGLQDQPLREPLVVIAAEATENVTLIRHEQRAINLEPLGRQSFKADGGIAPSRAASEVLAKADLRVEIRIDCPAVEQLHFRFFEATG